MANIKGFAYYNVDTNRYQDIRIKRLKRQLGCTGLAVYDYILCEIYRVKGCFLVWDENTILDVAEYLCLEETQVIEIVNYCCNVGLFNEERYANGNILTSESIQRRYTEMCRRAKRMECIIPEKVKIIPEEMENTPEEVQKTPEVFNKEKKSKVKKSKVKKIIIPTDVEIIERDNAHEDHSNLDSYSKLSSSSKEEKSSAEKEDFESVWTLYDKKVGDKKKLRKKWESLSEEVKNQIIEYIPRYKEAQPDKSYRKNFETFLNNKSWLDEIIQRNGNEKINRPLTNPKQDRDNEFVTHITAKLSRTSAPTIRD